MDELSPTRSLVFGSQEKKSLLMHHKDIDGVGSNRELKKARLLSTCK